MPDSNQLRERRGRTALTQAQVAHILGVTRELVSMWENGARIPSRRQREQLAQLYGIELAALSDAGADDERARLLRHLPQGARTREEVGCWLDFLDRWADCRAAWGETLPGPGRPPRALGTEQLLTDARRAPTFAVRVREHYRLGLDALPNLRAFFDEQDILVYRAPLGPIGRGDDGVSGAFYNHPRLGYCLLVNADTTPGRQAFTLAHEFAHALCHYPLGGLISRKGDRDARETFADAFAAHFLVPGKPLRRLTGDERARDDLDPYQALRLADYFRVSYATILVRLREEGLIAPVTYRSWQAYSPGAMARAAGLDDNGFRIPDRPLREIERFPLSVLERVKRAVRDGAITVDRASSVLAIASTDALRHILDDPPRAEQGEEREFAELPFPEE